MAIRNTSAEVVRFNNTDNLRTTIHELRRIKTAIAALSTNIGGGSATLTEQQSQTTLLNTIEAVLSTNEQGILFSNWEKIPGNTKEFTWVVGAVQPFVIDTIEYKTGATVFMTQVFTYDGQDNILTITSS